PSLPPPAIQFADFAVWQRAHVTEEVLGRQLAWWARALAGSSLGPAIAFDRRPAVPTRRIESRSVTVGADSRRRLDELARATGSTVFVVTLAAVEVALHRLSGASDFALATTLSGRNRVELEGMVGMFSGIGRIRADLAGDPSFAEVVGRARDYVLGMFENQDIPFLRVRRAVLPAFPADADPVTLAGALPVDFEYFHTGGHRDDGAELFFRGQLHPLSLVLEDDGTEIDVQLSYKADFYDASTIEALAAGFEDVLATAPGQPWLRLSELRPSRR
ncbi:MAG TPA: condensation domain-containing protein, partial [Acidimicrobiales bacterium]|nr:condensation domain-containing protein [Acidimicrobiales bacterium]